MWQPSGTSQSKYQTLIRKYDIHVLLVDHDQDSLIYMVDLLESCSYKVTAVESGRVALSILTKRKKEFDLMLADTNLPDLDVIKLLQVASDAELPSILMSVEDDKLLAEMAVSNGAILLLQKPFTMETAKNFWQLVMKERTPKTNNLVGQDILAEIIGENERYFPPNIEMAEMVKRKESNGGKTNGIVPKKKQRIQKSSKDGESAYLENYGRSSRVKRKVCTEWTEELHSRFVDAVNHLGDGRCYPKEILDLMNVPGLTRMQVASHLQKCRNDDWRAPHTRRSTQPQSDSPTPAPIFSNPKPNGPNPRKFGSMPRLASKQKSDTLGKELEPRSTGILACFAKTQSLPNQNVQQMPVTTPLPPLPVPNLPPSFENVDEPGELLPNPTMQMNMDGPLGAYPVFDSTIPTTEFSTMEFGDVATTPRQDTILASANKAYPQSYEYLPDFSVDFLPDFADGFANNINGLPEGVSSAYPSPTYQQFADEFTSIFSDPNPMATNRDTSGLWSFEMENFFSQP